MAKFKPGESVVCIDDDFKWAIERYGPGITWPVRGRCYVVRSYIFRGHHPAILLQGIVNPKVRYLDRSMREAGFWEERFEKAPGIESLTRIADEISGRVPMHTKKVKEEA